MRTMVRAVLPVKKGNELLKSGKIQEVIEHVMTELKPESAYFFAEKGQRSMMFVFDMPDASDIPRVAEALFFGLHAEVTFTPVMNADDLKKGVEKAGPVIAKFG